MEARHGLEIDPGGILARLLSEAQIETSTTIVNSLHRQAICGVGAGIRIEARAPDGTIEAISVEGAPAFALGVQWHPEWHNTANGLDSLIWSAFSAACQARAIVRLERVQ